MLSPAEINALINAAGKGDRNALDAALPGLYEQLHSIASAQMKKESPGHLLQTTAIVHEAYFRLSTQKKSEWKDSSHFFAAASIVMKRVLVDSARKEKATKRGGQVERQNLSDTRLAFHDQGYSILEINEAIERLSAFAPEQAKAIEMMIFGGMTGEEVATALDVSPSTIDRRVRSAKAWLRRELSDQ